MRRAVASLITGIPILLFTVFFRISLTHSDEGAFVEDDVEKLELSPKRSTEQVSTECCVTGSASFINKHYFLASTIDGKVTAMDIDRNGEVVWIVDADKVPLLSSSLNERKLIVDNLPYILVPSLDGSLYLFDVKSSSLNLIPLSANARIMIGNDEIAGGTFVTSTGIDPLTGKIRYRCTAGKCIQYEATTNNSSLYTLIMRKNTQVARAADPVTGTEKWNLSVGEYDVILVPSDQSLRFEQANVPAHIRFLLEPPSGIVSAVDSCGNLKWEKQLSSPVARAWQLSRGRIFEISLFSSETIDALSDFSGSGHQFIAKYEAPFYLGTVNSEPYIIPSELMREELRWTSADMRSQYHHQTLYSSHYSRAPFLEDLKVGDLIRRSYKTTGSAVEANQMNNMHDSVASKSLTCNMYDAVTIAGSKKLREDIGTKGDHGWYIFKPLRKPCQKSSPFQEMDQKRERRSRYNYFCRRKNVLEELKQIAYEPVSGWWKIVALCLTLIAASLTAVIIFYWQQIQHLKLFVLLHDLRKKSHTHSKTSLPLLQKTSYLGVGTSVGTGINRKTSTTAQSTQELFSSKFLEDFVPEKWLGRGGYGVVFNCRNRLDDRSYAVKRIAVSNTTAAIDHVKREARAMARLDHPGIIRYFHTWMEKPPSGWQQAKDQEILRNIRAIENSGNKSVIRTLESEQSISQSKNLIAKDSSVDEALLHGLNLNVPIGEKDVTVSGNNDNLSWMSDDNDSGLRAAINSSSFDNDSKSIEPEITALSTGSDDSASIIFAHCRNCLRSTEEIAENESGNKKLLDHLEPPAILVTSMCDLQNCKNIKDYVYLYIQMELCQELTLHSWLLANNRNEDREITRMRIWFAELVCAIDYIHSQGLIHRDLKPQNIFFSADNYLKIGDLGLVTNYITAEERTSCKQDVITNISHTSFVGTRLYMSPEQLKGKPYNEKVDVFSLGLIFVELIVPFTTVMERNSILSGLQSDIMPKCLDNLPSKEKKFVAWLTVVDPELRPSARQLAECDYLHNEVLILIASVYCVSLLSLLSVIIYELFFAKYRIAIAYNRWRFMFITTLSLACSVISFHRIAIFDKLFFSFFLGDNLACDSESVMSFLRLS
ncbi:Eukaryotic translation initiation factor 2-alpha kinase [Dirofilaria immitis]